jgi:predicted flap endonuclease-1-like 5' DNA nuclease
MTYLISQLWLYLLCAGLLGLLLGWVIWGWWGRRLIADARADHERERLALEQRFEADRVSLQEERAAAFLARDDALKVKASLIGELEGERKAGAEAKAEIGRLTQADLAARGEYERNLAALEEQIELERSTAAEARKAVDAIRIDMRQQVEEKEEALNTAETVNETLRARLQKIEADAQLAKAALQESLEAERNAKTSLQADLQRDRAELGKIKDAANEVQAEMSRQIQAKQAALVTAENAASAAKRDVEAARHELTRFKDETAKANDETLKTMEQSLNDERRSKAALEAELRRERAELSAAKDAIDEARVEVSRHVQEKQTAIAAAQSEAKLKAEMAEGEIARLRSVAGRAGATSDEIERLRSQLSAISTRGEGDRAEAERLRRELVDAQERERNLDAELARLRKLLSERETVSAKPAGKPAFTTDAPRPVSLYDRRPEIIDDLKEVKGIGPVMERILNENGCYHFKQLANFSARDIEWISQALGSFPDRIERDDWVDQAKALYVEKYGQRHDVGEVRTLETVS